MWEGRKREKKKRDPIPFLSSMVTVSLAHFMRNLGNGAVVNQHFF